MCGIAGILHFDQNKKVDRDLLATMRDTMLHRGPDGVGLYLDGHLGLAHLRLSIIDLSSKGHQPFASPDGRYQITYNGEIFNFLELKEELVKDNIRFRSSTDTEVLLHMFIKHGESMLHKLNGMFSFAIWDSVEKHLFIARDRVGVKPLYYAVENNTFYFASEPKAILASGINASLNEECFEELLLFRYIAGENTIFKNIKRLLPGHSLSIKNGNLRFNRWWNLPDKIIENRENLPDRPFDWFEEVFHSSIKLRTISDVPLGIMLSGGLDSGSVAAALHNNGCENLSSFTVTFDDPKYDEGDLARIVADKFNFQYHSLSLKGEDLLDLLSSASWYHDEPLVHQNDAQMLALAKYAKDHVTVLLSGEGGDELLGGYFRYKPLNRYGLTRALKPFIKVLSSFKERGIVNRYQKLDRYMEDNRLSSLLLFNASNLYPADFTKFGLNIDPDRFAYRQSIISESMSIFPKEPARQAMYLDLFTHMSSILDRNDRMTMGASIECRVPFLDYRFLEMLPALPSDLMLKGKKGKFLLYQTMGKHLPKEVLKFKKLGFSVPWEQYFKEDKLFMNAMEQYQKEPIFDSDIFSIFDFKKIKKSFIQGDQIATTLFRQMFMLGIWSNAYLGKENIRPAKQVSSV